MSNTLVVVVTGTSRGIGKGITNVLAIQQLDRQLTIYATSRSGAASGVEVASSNLIKYHKLDTTDQASISSFFEQVQRDHGAADILINNAAISNDYCENPEYAIQTIWNNYGGTRDMCVAFLRQKNLRAGARIVNVISGLNALSSYGTKLQQKIGEVSTVADIDALANSFLEHMSASPEAQESDGWGANAHSYKGSIALINTLTAILARQNSSVMINSCCPGWVNTDMGKQRQGTPPKAPE
jgi:carbonyl reductase 1